jgi:hypothetical protein
MRLVEEYSDGVAAQLLAAENWRLATTAFAAG